MINSTRRSLAAVLLVMPLVPDWVMSSARRVVEIDIASDGDRLVFIPDHLTCATGVHVRLRFRHLGEIIDDPHDWVLLKPGMESAFLAVADNEQDDGVVIPLDARNMVIAATPLCARGKTVTVEFTAPAPGEYPFVCSVPGHGETMRGILTVTARRLSQQKQDQKP